MVQAKGCRFDCGYYAFHVSDSASHQQNPGCSLVCSLEKKPSVQLICVGPVIDLYGRFAAEKLARLMEIYPERVYSKPEFTALPPYLFSGADFALIPSRDEPFGLVAVEFGRKGALGVGSRLGGLGLMPGWVSAPAGLNDQDPLTRSPLSGSLSSPHPPTTCYHNLRRRSSWHSSLLKKNALFSVLGLQFSVSLSSSGVNARKTSTSEVSTRAATLQVPMLGVPQIARRPCLSPISRTRTGPPSNLYILKNLDGALGAHEAHVQIFRREHLGRIPLSTRTTSRPRPVCRNSAAEPLSAVMSLMVKTTSHLTPVGLVQRPVEANNTVISTSCHEQTKLLQKSRSMLETHFWMVPDHQHDPSLNRFRGFPPGNRLPALWMRRVTRLSTRQWNRCVLSTYLKGLFLTLQQFTDQNGEVAKTFVAKLQSLDAENSKGELSIERFLVKSEEAYFHDVRKEKIYAASVRSKRESTFSSHRSSFHYDNSRPGSPHANSSTAAFDPTTYAGSLPNDTSAPLMTRMQIFMAREIKGWPLYTIILAIGQMLGATSFQITLLTGQNFQNTLELYVLGVVFLVASIVWYTLFRMKPSVWVLSLPWIFFGLAFFLVGLPSVSSVFDRSHDAITSAATWCYAIASAAGFLFFGLNFGEEAGAATEVWTMRACIVQGSQQIWVTALWYWGASLNGAVPGTKTPWWIVLILWPLSIMSFVFMLCIFKGLPGLFFHTSPLIPLLITFLRRILPPSSTKGSQLY